MEAYKLEKEVARYPRVILQPAIVEAGLRAEPPIDHVFAQLIRANNDGFSMVHYLWALRIAADSQSEGRELIDGIARFLGDEETRLASDPDKVREWENVRWFRDYFTWATERGQA